MTPDTEALQDLLARVEAATGADAVIDLDLWCATADRHQLTITQAPFTASLDATLALVERVLPGGIGVNLYIRGGGTSVGVWTDEDTEVRAIGKTPVLALLAALLKVLIAQETKPLGRSGEEKI